MSAKAEKKTSIFAKEISFGKKKNNTAWPTKTSINFIHDVKGENNRKAITGFVLFLGLLAIFTYFGVFRLLQRADAAQSAYRQMQSQIDELNASTADYEQVQAQYDEIVGSFLTDEEAASLNRTEMLNMIEEDIVPSIGVNSIRISGSSISVSTGQTDLSTVSNVIARLQADTRNAYVTVTTTAAADSDANDLVTADFEITYAAARTAENGGGN
jgi:Tfp pilus assembly protein PilN